MNLRPIPFWALAALLALTVAPVSRSDERPDTAGAEAAPPQEQVAEAADFSGLWDTTFGRLRLVSAGGEGQFQGSYELGGLHNEVVGGLDDEGDLVFRYTEPGAKGEGLFALAEDGLSFSGKWREDGVKAWSEWDGQRVIPVPGRRWLVVVEARWERRLAQEEYAFGDMLESFFDRVPAVEVRHRFFENEEGFLRWCREIAFLAEPVVVAVATHATEEGLTVGGEVIRPEAIAEAFSNAGNLELLHFSSCRIMDGDAPKRIRENLTDGVSFPISGYASSVDWAASAVLEFAYFDMVLTRRMPPAEAASQLPKLMPFAGDEQVEGTTVPPAKFRFLPD